jgi:hypothetical protein
MYEKFWKVLPSFRRTRTGTSCILAVPRVKEDKEDKEDRVQSTETMLMVSATKVLNGSATRQAVEGHSMG